MGGKSRKTPKMSRELLKRISKEKEDAEQNNKNSQTVFEF